MVKCLICGGEFRALTHKHLAKHSLTIEEYLEKFFVTKESLTSNIVRDKMSGSQKGLKMGDANPSRRPEVREKISKTLEAQWKKGAFADRTNGMTGTFGRLSPNYKPEVHTPTAMAEREYVDFLSCFHPIDYCFRCGKDTNKINIHHIDEDHSNFLVSNLEPLCVPCHTSYHYKTQKLPFITVVRTFSFAAAHYLPYYDGKCRNLHGHEWRLGVKVKKRIDKKSMMVMDFSDLKEVVNAHVIDKLDHSYINDKVHNPTAENIVVFIWELLMFSGWLKGIEEIVVWESGNSYCSIDKHGMLSIFKENIEGYMQSYGKQD